MNKLFYTGLLVFVAMASGAFAGERKIVLHDGKIWEPSQNAARAFAEKCVLRGNELDTRLFTINPAKNLRAIGLIERIKGHVGGIAGRYPQFSTREGLACVLELQSFDPELSFAIQKTPSTRLDGQKPKVACASELQDVLAQANTVTAEIKRAGIFLNACRIESVEVTKD